MIESFIAEFQRYRVTAEKAMAQIPDEALNRMAVREGNSIGMIVRHLSGNLVSRFTDFLTTDGEKPWRIRDSEFEERAYTREEVDRMWEQAWEVLERALNALSDTDLYTPVYIRGQEMTVHTALARALGHVSYHTGQIVLLARLEKQEDWTWISIPKGQSEQFNRDLAKQ